MTAAAVGAPASPGKARWSREEIVRLGGAGKAWDFLPVGLRALEIASGDVPVRALVAANFGLLGLVTPAREHLRSLPAGALAAAAAVQASISDLPSDRIDPAEAIATCRANLEAVGPKDELAGAFEPWAAIAARTEWFRARDGNIVRRRDEAWALLGDHAGAAARFTREHFGGPELPAMVTVEGVDPPWILREVARATGRDAHGFRPRLLVVQADPMEFLDGLALADVREVLAEDRTTLFVGPGCGERLEEWLRSRFETQLSGPCIPLRTLRTSAGADAILDRARRDQQAEHESLLGEVRANYAGRGRAWWRTRFGAHVGSVKGQGPGDPLRVLIPTSRYTTFVQHSSADLADALRRAGHEAELLIEPDSCSRSSSLAYLRRIASWKPDLIVLINWARSMLRLPLPAELPFVCWIQDAMPQQFDASAGAAQGMLDFIVGHVHPELLSQYGYARERAMAIPVAVSGTKFHAGPAIGAGADRLACEIGFVSHHAETPERLHARLAGEGDPRLRRVMEALRPRVERIAATAMEESAWWRLEQAARASWRETLGGDAPPKAVTWLHRHYALPLADRILRHEALAWAAEIADRRGWRLKLFGRGWDGHETLGRYACGELKHGEELRCAYGAAAVQLHVTLYTLVHQRVLECALSGGLPVCRAHADALTIPLWRAQRALSLGRPPTCGDPVTRREGYWTADAPEAMVYAALRQRMGLPASAALWMSTNEREALALGDHQVTPDHDPVWLLGDPAEVAFTESSKLEAIVERAVEDPAWRRRSSEGMARRTRSRLTLESFVQRVLAFITRSLEERPAPERGRVNPADGVRVIADAIGLTGVTTAEIARAAADYAPPAWTRGALEPGDAAFLYGMIRAVRPSRVIEIGVASGASSAVILRALRDAGIPLLTGDGSAALHCFDIASRCYFDANRPVGAAIAEMTPDLVHGACLHLGKTACDVPAALGAHAADLALVDGDHRHPWPVADVLALVPALRARSWIVLHDIELPEYARRAEIAEGRVLDWRQQGAHWLFHAWPGEKIRGEGAAFNIGAIRVPKQGISAGDLERLIDFPWETDPGDGVRRLLGR